MEKDALHTLTATEAQKHLQERRFTLEQYVQSLLARYRARGMDVNAWETISPDRVLEQARQLDRLPPDRRGRLHGFVVGVKDVISTQDLPTKHNSPLHSHDPPLIDASTVAILRYHGALIMGKTKTTEFSVITSAPGTKNPHDASRSPGGSSSGSAAAVADMQIPIGLGTQTIGSVIRPASFNGIYGFKPTWNAISAEGQKTTSLTLDTFGFMSRSVSDLQTLAGILGLRDDEPPGPVNLSLSKFAVVRPPMWPDAGPGTMAAMDRAAQILRDSGAFVENVSLPADFDGASDLQTQVLRGETSVTFYREHSTAFNMMSADLANATNGIETAPRRTYLRAFDSLAALRPKMDELAQKYTAIVTPSSVDAAPVGAGWTGDPKFNGIWTGLHTPVINIPGFQGEGGMPLGISLVAPRYRDQHLLQVAAVVGPLFEAQGGWKSRL